MKRKLERLGLEESVLKRLTGASVVTVEDLLQRTALELVQSGFFWGGFARSSHPPC